MSDGIEVIVAFPVDGEDGEWTIVETGLFGEFNVQEGKFIIPFQDDVTAEEVARIITGTITRETEGE